MLFLQVTDKPQGLVTNGAKVYVCGLESDPIGEVEASLDELGRSSGAGGSAIW